MDRFGFAFQAMTGSGAAISITEITTIVVPAGPGGRD